MPVSYDYIVAGGGSAGCVIAARLSERPDIKVLLLEFGEPDRHFLLKMPLAYRMLRDMPQFDWGYMSEPEPFADNRVMPVARGKVLGGSSSINGMMYSRGHPRDYDQWRQMGAEGWAWDDVLPYFRKSENNWRGEGPMHGGSGPMHVARSVSPEPISQAITDTARALRYRVLDDFEAGDPEGFSLPDSTVFRGRRSSASKAFIDPARKRPNLTIVTGARVARVTIEHGRATGVAYLKNGRMMTARAEREVVLSGGAYGSPHMLMLSGIGPADHLRDMGVPVVADLPNVGQGLQEHPLAPMAFTIKKPFRFTRELRLDRMALNSANWLFNGRGILARMPMSSLAYYKSQPDLERPDLESVFMSTNLAARLWFPGVRTPVPDLLSMWNVVLRPGSRGFVKLRSADPVDPPRIQLNLLQDPDDLRLLRHSLRWTRDFVRQGKLAEHVGPAVMPVDNLETDAELDAFIRQNITITHHPACTCAMGTGDGHVVDPRLRVRGVDGLRVADASVMPALIGGHTNAPSIMIGEKAADMILAN